MRSNREDGATRAANQDSEWNLDPTSMLARYIRLEARGPCGVVEEKVDLRRLIHHHRLVMIGTDSHEFVSIPSHDGYEEIRKFLPQTGSCQRPVILEIFLESWSSPSDSAQTPASYPRAILGRRKYLI